MIDFFLLFKSQVLEFMKICYLVWCLGAFILIPSKYVEKITANEKNKKIYQSAS